MKRFLHIWALLLLLPWTVVGADAFSVTVTNTKVANQRRYVTTDIRLSEKVSVTKETTLLVVVGRTKPGGPADEFGPPQNFALKGTSHEIEPRFFRVKLALPLERVDVKFMLTDGKKVLYEQRRQL